MKISLVLQGLTPLWHAAQWVSRAPPHHTISAFLNLVGTLKVYHWVIWIIRIKKWLFWEKEPEVKNRNSFLTEIRISGCKLGFDIEPVLRLKTSLWNFSTVGIYVDPVLFIVLVTFNVVDKLFIINILKLMPNAYCSYFSITPAYKEYPSIPHRLPPFNTKNPSVQHTHQTKIAVELMGFGVELRDFWCGNEVCIELRGF